MKKIAAYILALIMIVSFLPVSSSAEYDYKDYSGLLEPFENIQSYSGVFTDVTQGSWYENGVKCVYEAGIMNGVKDASFDPDGKVTMVQAITVASRVHAQYYGKTIAEVSGAWYEMYYQYAQANNMLPPDISRNTDLKHSATRAFLAFVFSKSIDSSDLPAINTAAVIADFNTIDATYQNAVKTMYESGIITGMDNNKFNPYYYATRAQMSVIIMRLIEPCERASSDAKLDEAFLAQQSNVMNHIPFYSDGNGNSVLSYNYTNCGPEYPQYLQTIPGCELIQSEDGENYTISQYDGSQCYSPIINREFIYLFKTYYELIDHCPTFINQGILKKSPNSEDFLVELGTARESRAFCPTMFLEQSDMECITLYNDNIYLLFTNLSDGRTIDIYSFMPDGQNEKILSTTIMSGYGEHIAVFNDTIYYNVGSKLYSYKIGSQEEPQLIRTGIADWVMNGNTIYFCNYGSSVYMIAANYPELIKKISDTEKLDKITFDGNGLNFIDGILYYLDENHNLYKYENSRFTLLCSSLPECFGWGIIDDSFCYKEKVVDYSFKVVPFSDTTNIMTPKDWYIDYYLVK